MAAMAPLESHASEVGEWLAASVLFRRLAAEDRARIAGLAELRSFRRGRTVFREGDPARHFYTVVSGRVKVVKTTPAGKEVILELFGPGDPLGAIAAYEGHPLPATAVATEAATCLVLLILLASRDGWCKAIYTADAQQSRAQRAKVRGAMLSILSIPCIGGC